MIVELTEKILQLILSLYRISALNFNNENPTVLESVDLSNVWKNLCGFFLIYYIFLI